MTPLLSIVTVVKDDESGLMRTQSSLKNFTPSHDHDIEWVVVDSSRDPERVVAVLAATSMPALLVRTPPQGVYPAMNIGLTEATGDYVFFLNAGDELRDGMVLETVLDSLRQLGPKWAYGDVAFIDEGGRETLPKSFDYRAEKQALFARGRFPPHQGTFVQRQILCALGGFNTGYQVAADYAIALRLSELEDPLEINITVANFYTGGLSTVQWQTATWEFHRARRLILRPRGLVALREFVATAAQFLQTSLSRILVHDTSVLKRPLR